VLIVNIGGNEMNDTTIYAMTTPCVVRQGDVLIIPITKAVEDVDIGDLIEEPDRKRVVLAHGEATGHAHAFYAEQTQSMPDAQLFNLRNRRRKYAPTVFEDVMLLRLRAPATLRHEEHAPIRLLAGDYAVVRQHEFEGRQGLRRVAD
jgi:ribosomal protein L12E/L44/L45/RPP1/RPP2